MVLPKQPRLSIVLAAAAALVLLGSSAHAPAEVAANPLSVTFRTYGIDSPSSQTVHAKPGDTVKVGLSAPSAVLHEWTVVGVSENPDDIQVEGEGALEAVKAAVQPPEKSNLVISKVKTLEDDATTPGGPGLHGVDVTVGPKKGTFGVVFGFSHGLEPESFPRLFLLKIKV